MRSTILSNIMLLESLRSSLSEGKASVGTWCQINSSTVSSILSADDFDWICFDLEHGEIDLTSLVSLSSSVHCNNKLAFARLPNSDPSVISRALDYGVDGLIFPKVQTRDDMLHIISSAYYPPLGERGVAFMNANNYGIDFDTYLSKMHTPFIGAMIETSLALENLSDILSVSGIDAVLIGPYDLSSSLGIPGKLSDPLMIDAVEFILETCKGLNISCGMHVVSPIKHELDKVINRGFCFIPYGLDTLFLQNRRFS